MSVASEIEEEILQLNHLKKKLAHTANELLRPIDKFVNDVTRMQWRGEPHIVGIGASLQRIGNSQSNAVARTHHTLDYINKHAKRDLADVASLINTLDGTPANTESGYAIKNVLRTSIVNTKRARAMVGDIIMHSHGILRFLQDILDDTARYISANESNNYLTDNATQILSMTKQQISIVEEAISNLSNVGEELERLTSRIEQITDTMTKELLTNA